MTNVSTHDYTVTPTEWRPRFRRSRDDDYRFWSDEAVKDHFAFLQRERGAAVIQNDELAANNLQWCEHRMDQMLEELERRKRLARMLRNDPRGPRWSDSGGRERSDLISLAQELKEHWRIDRFLTEMMMVRLQPAGRNRWRTQCLSPNHQDRQPSMVVFADGAPSDDHVHCFSCNEFHADVIDLTKMYFGTDSFREAVRKLADATGLIHHEAA